MKTGYFGVAFIHFPDRISMSKDNANPKRGRFLKQTPACDVCVVEAVCLQQSSEAYQLKQYFSIIRLKGGANIQSLFIDKSSQTLATQRVFPGSRCSFDSNKNNYVLTDSTKNSYVSTDSTESKMCSTVFDSN